MTLVKINAQYLQLCTAPMLKEAWKRVHAKGTAGGIDKMSVDTFALEEGKYLDDLLKKLEQKAYLPKPYLEVHIPKGEDAYRRLGLLSVTDKIVQQSILLLIQDRVDKQFLNCSYGYRKGKGAIRAVRRVWHHIKSDKMRWFLKCDLDNFFDNIPHQLLHQKLKKWFHDEDLINLMLLCVKMGRVDRKLNWNDSDKGIPQGALLSPLLANIYLHDLDEYMVKKSCPYVRYADDFLILAASKKDALRFRQMITNFTKHKLQLPFNENIQLAALIQGVDYLGISFFKNKYALREEKIKRLKQKIVACIDPDELLLLDTFQDTYDGIFRYYGQLIEQRVLEPIDQYLVEVLAQRAEQSALSKRQIKNRLKALQFLTPKYQKRTKQLLAFICGEEDQPFTSNQEIRIDYDEAIRQRKKEYDQLRKGSYELILNKPGLFLGLSKFKVTVKDRGVVVQKMPLDNLKHISVLNAGISISAKLILTCAEKGIPIDIFNQVSKPSARLFSPSTTNVDLWLAQLKSCENGIGLEIMKRIVAGKMRNQINLVKYYFKYYKKADPEFAAAFKLRLDRMENIREKVINHQADSIDELRLSLFGHEGVLANHYWALIRILIDEETDFKKRERQGASDLVNSMLNYGYGILYARIWAAILKARLNPYLSFLHSSQNNKPSLVFDLIEEFRQPIVDRTIFALINRRESLTLTKGRLSISTKKKLVAHIMERLHQSHRFRGQQSTFGDIINFQARHLARVIQQKNKTYKPYSMKY